MNWTAIRKAVTPTPAEAVLYGGTCAAIFALSRFARGFALNRDLWDARDFVLLYWGGALASVAAVGAVVAMRRARTGLRAHVPFAVLAAATLGIHLFLFCFMGSVSLRSAWHSAGRRVVTFGMARDIPPPPPGNSGAPAGVQGSQMEAPR